MKIKFRVFRKGWKSISIYTKNKEMLIRYWSGIKFDVVTFYNPNAT